MSNKVNDFETSMRGINEELKDNIDNYIASGNIEYLDEIDYTVVSNFNELLNDVESEINAIERKINLKYQNNKIDINAVSLMSHSALIDKYSKELNLSVPLRREIYYSSLKEKIRMWMYIIGIVFLVIFIVKYMLKINVENSAANKDNTNNKIKINNPFKQTKTENKSDIKSLDKEIVSPLKEDQ